MPTFTRLISAVKVAEQIMGKWSKDESNAVDLVILPADNTDLLTDDEEVQDYTVMIDNGLPSDVCDTVQVQTNFLSGEDNHDEVEDDNNAEEGQTESRAQNEKKKHMLELLKDVEECKSKPRSLMNKIPAEY